MSNTNESVSGSGDEIVYESIIGNVNLIQSRENTIANRVVYNGPVIIHQQVRSDLQPVTSLIADVKAIWRREVLKNPLPKGAANVYLPPSWNAEAKNLTINVMKKHSLRLEFNTYDPDQNRDIYIKQADQHMIVNLAFEMGYTRETLPQYYREEVLPSMGQIDQNN